MLFARGCLLLFLLFNLNLSINDGDEFDLTVFNNTLIEKFERQVGRLQPIEYRRFLSRLGKIAFFSRLTRRFARSPNIGKVDFEHFFPKPELPFHRKLYTKCTVDILTCVDFIFENLQSRASFLFPIKGQRVGDFKISDENFNRMLTSNLFQFDVSITYLFCYLAKNQFNALQQLPYCSYGAPNGTKQTWPADRYKELAQRSEIYIEFGEDIEPIDELANQERFQCAEQSFCPNPCCGYQVDTSKCSHPICRNATAEMHCSLHNELNSNLMGMAANEWNVSCKCDSPGHIFRFDVERCVDRDECADVGGGDEEQCPVDEHKECVNTDGSFLCQCQMGFVRDATIDQCVPLHLSAFDYSGPAVGFK